MIIIIIITNFYVLPDLGGKELGKFQDNFNECTNLYLMQLY